MEAVIMIDGRELTVDISEEELNKILPKKEVNYDDIERVKKLYEKLVEFSVNHRTREIDMDCYKQEKFSIYFSYSENNLAWHYHTYAMGFGEVLFDSRKAVELAIETFRDELIWYFTEFKDSL